MYIGNLPIWFKEYFFDSDIYKVKNEQGDLYLLWNAGKDGFGNLHKPYNSLEWCHGTINGRVLSKNISLYEILSFLKNEKNQ